LCEPHDTDIGNNTLAEVALVGGQIPEARVSRDDCLRRKKSQCFFCNDCSPELEVTIHSRHLVALVHVLERLEKRRLGVAVLRREEELIFAVVVFGPNVQGLCKPATQLRIDLLDVRRDYTVMADRQIDALL
jgi:hypothetical protein